MKIKILVLIAGCFLLGGCSGLLIKDFNKTCPVNEDITNIKDLISPVVVSRNAYGVPLIKAKNLNDLAFACGYTDAFDRLNQMVSLKLASQGRLGELGGESFLGFDVFIRSLDFSKRANALLKGCDHELLQVLEYYSKGVNEYISKNINNLPPALKLSGYTPESWTPYDSASIFILLNLGLSLNLHEETAAFYYADKVKKENLAWLFPVYPNEDLPFSEVEKFTKAIENTKPFFENGQNILTFLNELGFTGNAASNNWVVASGKTEQFWPILANDTHLPISLPSMWNLKHLKCDNFNAAGIAVVGFPAIVAGYNGRISWGMTMVMADNQDLFVEKLKKINGRLHYLYKGKWIETNIRQERITLKDSSDFIAEIHETVHGPLINNALSLKRVSDLQPYGGKISYGISLSTPYVETDDSFKRFFNINRASNVDEAMNEMKNIKAIALNFIVADQNDIGWQVTGLYPLRKAGRGLLPSPGWNGNYDWNGYISSYELPYSKNPEKGFIATANNKTVSSSYKHVLSSSWYYCDRVERIEDLLLKDNLDFDYMMEMHGDVQTYLPLKLRQKGIFSVFSSNLEMIISSFNETDKKNATEILEILSGFNGKMNADSMEACVYGAFMHCVSKRIFYDELGPETESSWKFFCESEKYNYSPLYDHLLYQEKSPFFDDINTAKTETKYEIIARAFADTKVFLENTLGKDIENWKWGKLHKYYFEAEVSKMSDHMGWFKKTGMSFLKDYFNRGPYAAPGDFGTVNVSSGSYSNGFDVWMIPAMRIITDFSLDEPFFAVNSTGQSDHPSSPHYDDGIDLWLKGKYMNFPFQENHMKDVYEKSFILSP